VAPRQQSSSPSSSFSHSLSPQIILQTDTAKNQQQQQRADVRNKRESSPKISTAQMLLWKKIFDSGSGHHYYYNRATGASVWERPKDFYSALVPPELAHYLQTKADK
jgi:hypothetical protein